MSSTWRRRRARLRLILREIRIASGIVLLVGLLYGCWGIVTMGPR